MGRPITVTVQLDTADADGIAESQSPAGAEDLVLDGVLVSGGVAILDAPRRVLITSGGNDTGITYTIYGTDRNGREISETLAGVNNDTTYTEQDFLTVTRIAVSGAVATTIEAGTNGVGSSRWLLVNRNAQPVQIGIGVKVDGTVDYTVETTYDEIMGEYTPGVGVIFNQAPIPTVYPDSILVGQSGNGDTTLNDPVIAVRLTVNSGTGAASMTFIQAGIVG